jgi:sugar phosphate permease
MRWRVFALTWLSYASYYLTRKPLSVAKKALVDLHGKATVTHFDTSYLAAYAGGQFLSGWLGDKLGPKRVIVTGMTVTALCSVLFGLSSAPTVFGIVWFVNGVAQSTGWSPNVKEMTAWFPSKGRGTIMGFWTTNYVVGGLVAGPIAAWFMAQGGGDWHQAFFGPAAIVFAMMLVVAFLLPVRRDLDPTAHHHPDAMGEDARREARARVLRTPLLWALGCSYFFMKLARYMLLFWLIYYMENELHYSNGRATWISTAFEAGGAFATISIGYISEKIGRGRRIPVGVISLLVLAIALPLYAWLSPLGVGWNVVGLVLVGFSLFGPDALLSATAAQDLAGPAAAATAAGVINGMGSIGPVFGSESFSALTTSYGWVTGFTVLGAGAFVSALILIPFWRRA